MRIALVVPGGVGKNEREQIPVLLSLIERLARRHDLIVVSLNPLADPGEYSLRGASVISLGPVGGIPKGARWLWRLRRLVSFLRSRGGVGLLHGFWLAGPGSLAGAAASLLRIPAVVSIGGGELVSLPEISYGSRGSLARRLETRFALRGARVVTGGSRFALDALPASLGSRAVWLPLGVDLGRFAGGADRPPGPPWRLLQVATLNRVKDQETLLRAVRILVTDGTPIQLDLIGEDTLGGRVQALAAELGIADSVRFHGFRPFDEIPPYYRAAHLYVQSSLHESMGAAALEAAASSLPVAGTEVGILAEMAPAAASAVPPRDPAALAAAIAELLHDPAKREALAGAALQFARTYSADWTAERLDRIYSDVSTKT